MSTRAILFGGPRDGMALTLNGSPPMVINFPFPFGSNPPMMPEPLVECESYRHDGADDQGLLIYRFIGGDS